MDENKDVVSCEKRCCNCENERLQKQVTELQSANSSEVYKRRVLEDRLNKIFDLKQFQKEQAAWSHKNFGKQQPFEPLLGLGEELGELFHSYLKRHQGIRGSAAEHEKKMKDAVGDIQIFLSSFCTLMEFDLESCVKETWNIVKDRDWTENKDTGENNKLELLSVSLVNDPPPNCEFKNEVDSILGGGIVNLSPACKTFREVNAPFIHKRSRNCFCGPRIDDGRVEHLNVERRIFAIHPLED